MMRKILFAVLALVAMTASVSAQSEDAEQAAIRKAFRNAYDKEPLKEYPQKGYIQGSRYTDSTRRVQFYFSSGDSIVNKSVSDKFDVTIYRKASLIRIQMGHFAPGMNLEEYARTSRDENNNLVPAGATNLKKGKLRHDKEHFCWSYRQSYTGKDGRDWIMAITFKLMYLNYDVAQCVAVFYDDAQAAQQEAAAEELAHDIHPIQI